MKEVSRREFLGLAAGILSGCGALKFTQQNDEVPEEKAAAIKKEIWELMGDEEEKKMLAELHGKEFCKIAFNEFEKLADEFLVQENGGIEEETQRFNRIFQQRMMVLYPHIIDIEFVPDPIKMDYRVEVLFKGNEKTALMLKIKWNWEKVKIDSKIFYDAQLALIQAFKQPQILLLNRIFRFSGKKKQPPIECFKGKCIA